jgi:hypothetical protein
MILSSAENPHLQGRDWGRRPGHGGLRRALRRLTDAIPIKCVASHVAMERIKATTVYPLDTGSR